MISLVETASAPTAVRIDGADTLPWIVLSNSLASNMSMWDQQIQVLSKHRRILRYDAPGHGASGLPTREFTLEGMADDVIELMDRFGIETADFMGLSMGGMIGLGLCLDHPQRIRTAVCACARGEFQPDALKGWDERKAAVENSGMEAILEGTLARWFTPSAPASVRRAAGEMILETSVEGYGACVSALKGLDFARRLSTCSVPIRFIAGEFDMGAPSDEMAAMAKATPGGSLTLIKGAAHLANMEATGAFNDAIDAFFLDAAR